MVGLAQNEFLGELLSDFCFTTKKKQKKNKKNTHFFKK
jgi:hypothetical protein